MRLRWALLAVAAALLLAGCVGPLGEEAGSAQPESSPSEADERGGSSSRAARGSTLGNLSMEGANATRRNGSAVVFRWEGTIPRDSDSISASFDVPAGAPFTVDAKLTWEGRSDLVLSLTSPGTEQACSTEARTTAGPAEPPSTCTVASFRRDAPQRWTTAVERSTYDTRRSAPFTVVLTVRLDDPEDVPDGPSLLGEPADEEVAPGWPEPGQAGIRPGVTVGGQLCTSNFVFASPRNATLYLGTASHCFELGPSRLGDDVPVARGAFNGTLVYCSWGAQAGLRTCPNVAFGTPGYRDDFALVRIPPEGRDEVHPATLVWGGPTGLLEEPPSPGTQVLSYGNSGNRDLSQGVNAGDSRRGVVAESNGTRTVAYFNSPVAPGDSGSGVTTAAGDAVGVLHTLSGRGETAPAGGGITNLARSLQLLEERTGHRVELRTWPLFETPEPVVQD